MMMKLRFGVVLSVLTLKAHGFAPAARRNALSGTSSKAVKDVDLLEKIAGLEKELEYLKSKSSTPGAQALARLINAGYATRNIAAINENDTHSSPDGLKVNAAYAARDIQAMSSRWGSEEIERVSGAPSSTASTARSVNAAYAARDVEGMSSRWGSEEIERVSGAAVLPASFPTIEETEAAVAGAAMAATVTALEAQLKDANAQIATLKEQLAVFKEAATPGTMAKVINSFFVVAK